MDNSQDVILGKHFADLAYSSKNRNMFCFSNFLGLPEMAVLDAFIKKEGFDKDFVSLCGGYSQSERKMARFGNPEELGWEEEFPIAVILAEPQNKAFSEDLSHRDYLGALMNLGINRDTIGDIRIEGSKAYIWVLRHLKDFIVDSLHQVRHTSMSVGEAERTEITIEERFEELELVIQSERLDSILSRLTHLSRGKAMELFKQGKVFLNGLPVDKGSTGVRTGDVITARGYGKFIYDGEARSTKKGKMVTIDRRYI